MNRSIVRLSSLMLCFSFFLSSCDKEKINATKLEQMLFEIKALAASSICDNNGTYELKHIRFGTRECGGVGYLAYSTSINVANLEKRVREYNDLERKFSERKNNGVDCLAIIIAPKSVACENGKPKLIY